MKQQIHLRTWASRLSVICAAAVLSSSAVNAVGTGQLGILNTSGINPTTGLEWQIGDQYRLTFITSGLVEPSLSTEIADYNAFVQDAADASTAFSISAGDGAIWTAIASTANTAARDNTSTNPDNSTGVPILLLDGSTVVADNNADLWDGSIQNTILLNENNGDNEALGGVFNFPVTGSLIDGTVADSTTPGGPLGNGGDVVQGRANDVAGWIIRDASSAPATTQNDAPLYAISNTLQVVPEASSAFLIGLVGLTLLRRRR
jgi:hypothetical protein